MQQRPQGGLTPKLQVTLRVNGVERRVSLRPWTTLLDALREVFPRARNRLFHAVEKAGFLFLFLLEAAE